MSMRRSKCVLGALAVALLGLTGCAAPRFVQVNAEGGVVALPSNTNHWPTYYRDKAEAMMRQKCPNGYEVVHEAEAVVGQVTHTHAQTDTQQAPTLLVGGGSGTAEKTRRGERHADSFGGFALPLGETQQTTQASTTSQNITEWRIQYRAK